MEHNNIDYGNNIINCMVSKSIKKLRFTLFTVAMKSFLINMYKDMH